MSTLCRGSSPTPTSASYCLVNGSNTICNSPSPPLIDIIRFGSLRITISLMVIDIVRFKIMRLITIRNGSKRTISISGGLGFVTSSVH